MGRDSLLLICKDQFGYHTDYFYWCKYLCSQNEINVICFDCGRPRIIDQNVKVSYIKWKKKTRFLSAMSFFLAVFVGIIKSKGKIVVSYFYGAAILGKLFPNKHILLDIRTADISKDNRIRLRNNKRIRKTASHFSCVSVISQGVINFLGLESSRCSIIPLGANVYPCCKKDYNGIRLLYVGTLYNRHIERTLEGLAKAIKLLQDMDITYDIVGDGPGQELSELKVFCHKLGLDKYVSFHGYLQHNRLDYFFSKCNVGISFVPITEYYNFQPPTKTYEYIFSGLFTIATKTYANTSIINDSNGMLIEDTSDSFAKAVLMLPTLLKSVNSKKIVNSIIGLDWQSVVNKYVCPVINSL